MNGFQCFARQATRAGAGKRRFHATTKHPTSFPFSVPKHRQIPSIHNTPSRRRFASLYNGYSYYYYSRAVFGGLATAAAVSLIGSKAYLYTYQQQQQPTTPQDASPEPSLLVLAQVDETNPSVLQWIHECLLQCYDLVLVFLRSVEIGLHLSPLLLLTPAAIATQYCCSGARGHSNISQSMTDLSWRYTTAAMQRLGPAWVKLCQWIATRRDLFPPHICNRLSILHDQGIPHAWEETDELLKEAFGQDYQEQGLEVQHVIGCGSAAQVYRGTLTDKNEASTTSTNTSTNNSTRKVAIKVLHPHFQQQIQRDLWLMTTVANLLHSLLPLERIRMMQLPRATKNFADLLQRQADLRIEADNLRQFRANFFPTQQDEDYSSIRFPKPIDGWTSERVLVEDLVEPAVPIGSFLCDSSPENMTRRKQLGGPLVRAFFKMVFLDNFVHCDMHPGNIHVKDDGKIVFLDAGIAFSLLPNDQQNLRDLFRAVVFNDGRRAGRLMVERARYESCTLVEGGVEGFASGIEAIVNDFHQRRGLTFGAIRIGSLLNRVLDLCRIYGVEIDPAMSSIVVSTLVLEGLARSLEPNMNLMEAAIPFVAGRGRV